MEWKKGFVPAGHSGNEHGRRYLDMPLKEKRQLYRCRDAYVIIDDIRTWSEFYHIQPQNFRNKVDEEVENRVGESFEPSDELNRRISLWQGDITNLEVDAIVNAANPYILSNDTNSRICSWFSNNPQTVGAAIKKAAGETFVEECRNLGGCKEGHSKITSGHQLPAKYVIHTVGPKGKLDDVLKSCYQTSLQLVLDYKIRTVAFCCLCTGVKGFPNDEAARIALSTVREFLEKFYADVDRVIFCTYWSKDFEIYQKLMTTKYFPCKLKVAIEVSDEEQNVAESASCIQQRHRVPSEN